MAKTENPAIRWLDHDEKNDVSGAIKVVSKNAGTNATMIDNT